MFRPLSVVLALALAPDSLVAAQDEAKSDAQLERLWSRLGETERRDVAEWFRSELAWTASFQGVLLAHLRGSEEQDPGFWPEAQPLPYFDPEREAPRQPIRRRRLDEDSSRVRRMVEKIRGDDSERTMRRAWAYDWSTGGILRTGDDRDPELVFANALAGIPPGADLAEALVLQRLDGGEEREALRAFGHAYTDRDGNVFPITLYEAWASGAEIETPDVDTLGLYHALGGRRGRYVAPVSPSYHRELYGGISERLVAAKHYRELRETLARAYLNANPVVPRGYATSLDRMHALWEKHTSVPALLAPELPDAAGWEDFLNDWAKTCDGDPECIEPGRNRRATLAWDAQNVRALFQRILEQHLASKKR